MKSIKYIIIIVAIAALSTLLVAYYGNINTENKLTTEKNILVYFLKNISPSKQVIVPVNRKVYSKKALLNVAISELLQGPTPQEKNQGYYTEIPDKTTLIYVKETHQAYIIGLSEDFNKGGGSESMSKRVEQVEKTAIANAGKRPVYLEVDGKKIKSLGGEGVEIPQPLKGP